MVSVIRIGCAGWALGKRSQSRFSPTGSYLERYASVLNAVEINSSFYRAHLTKTYQRWAASVSEDFRFSVKVPREITHRQRLRESGPLLERFLGEVQGLGNRLGPLLVQLPPSLEFSPHLVATFLEEVRGRFSGAVVCEPRHESWFGPAANSMLAALEIARVAADPAIVPDAAAPGGWGGLVYYRLHGSPKMYHSSYSDEYLRSLASTLTTTAQADAYCVFDNTASEEAMTNALLLRELVRAEGPVELPAP